MDYQDFLNHKTHEGSEFGFEPVFMPDGLFDFQELMIDWSLRKGRSGLFEDCGLGKTVQELTWAENVHRHTNKPVLHLTPLAVSAQTVREAEKFGIECRRSKDGVIHNGIVVTNYENLHKFSASDFAGVSCDESSILKSFDGSRRNEITEFMRKVPYRLLATATAAPNDYIELGTSSEALGYLGHMDMLNRFFKNDLNNSATKRMYGEAPKWRFKGHAEDPFWRWVVSWARAIRRPSDIGCSDNGFVLPPLLVNEHIVHHDHTADGMLFNLPAVTLAEQREEAKRTIAERCEMVAERVNATGQPALIWCHRNAEGDLLEHLIPDAVQVSGSDSDDAKEERFMAFADGSARILITKPKIGAWGLNFQHCAHVLFFPSHSYEQYYQGVRRCWRFGQKRPVHVDIVLTEGERKILENLQRKSEAADKMFARLVEHMNDALAITSENRHTQKMEAPTWL